MKLEDLKDIKFLTTNAQKAQDVKRFGIKIDTFKEEIPEVLSGCVETVVLHKARDTGLNNIIVEDTSLEIEGASFYGTEIKHVYDTIRKDISYNGKKAVWKVSMCLKKDGIYYISTGKLEGKLQYPELQEGYHFNKLLTVDVKNDGNYVYFENLNDNEKVMSGPRFKAISQLKDALTTGVYNKLSLIQSSSINDWTGEYQIENKKQLIDISTESIAKKEKIILLNKSKLNNVENTKTKTNKNKF